MATLVQVLQVEPAEIIRFKGAFTEVVSSDLKLTNPSAEQVAFKVKTTAPRRYAVRPNSGVLNPGETITVSVMRQPYDFDPAERVRHKFMIQSVKLLPGQTLANVWSEADPSTFMDTRLRVQFDDIPPSNRSSVTEEEFHRVMSENDKLSQEVHGLKNESNELRQLLNKASGAIEKALPRGVGLIFHEKINVLIILVCLVLAFFGGVILSETILPGAPVPAN